MIDMGMGKDNGLYPNRIEGEVLVIELPNPPSALKHAAINEILPLLRLQ